jgi:predicted metal-dependent hydrolase
MPKLRFGNEAIPYTIVHSSKARHKRIAISPAGIRVVLPEGTAEQEAIDLIEGMKRRVYRLREKVLLQDNRRKSFTDIRYVSGARMPVLGNTITVTVLPETRKQSRLEYDGTLTVRVSNGLTARAMEKEVGRKIEGWIKEQVLAESLKIVQDFGKKLGVLPKGLRIKGQRKLWGSCGGNHILNLNWRLGLFPRHILEYVVAHEMCHLRQMNHSRAFWSLVAALIPDYEQRRDWLKFKGGKER